MATDYFLWFDKGQGGEIKGETLDSTYKAKNAMELESVTFVAENKATISSGSGGAGTGKATFQDLEITMKLSQAAPQLFQACCMGNHYPKAYIALRKAGVETKGPAKPYCTLTLALVFVSKVEIVGGATATEDVPLVRVLLSCGAVEVSYQPQKADGGLGSPFLGTWSRVVNKSSLETGKAAA
jgi:type VI secretion system secreted protein Hcp